MDIREFELQQDIACLATSKTSGSVNRVAGHARFGSGLMSHPHRFFAPDITADMAEIVLPDEEAHHALRVARLREGSPTAVFNGEGLECMGVLRRQGARGAVVVVRQQYTHPPQRVAVTLAVGGLHREKTQEEIIRRAAELGVSRICFWRAEHSQRPITATARWRKTAVETCKQCGRGYLPRLGVAPSLDAFLASYNGPVLIAATNAASEKPTRMTVADRLALLVGPEGDFSEGELEAANAKGATPVSLGPYVYRTETAAAILTTRVADALKLLGPGLEIYITP